MDVKSLHFQSVACPRMRTLILQAMDFQSIVVDCGKKELPMEEPNDVIGTLVQLYDPRSVVYCR